MKHSWNLNDDQIEKYISLDTKRVRINVDDTAYMELDTWFGAKFERDIQHIPDGLVKVKPLPDIKATYISFFFADAYSFDIKWTTSAEN